MPWAEGGRTRGRLIKFGRRRWFCLHRAVGAGETRAPRAGGLQGTPLAGGCGGGGGSGGERPLGPSRSLIGWRGAGKTVHALLHLLRPSPRQSLAERVRKREERERDPRCLVPMLEARKLGRVKRRDSTEPRSRVPRTAGSPSSGLRAGAEQSHLFAQN